MTHWLNDDVAREITLSTLEFDVVWEAENLPPKHPALLVPSPGKTHSERRQLVQRVWDSLGARDLANGARVSDELADVLGMLAQPTMSIDTWVWARREIKSLTVVRGSKTLLATVDGDQVRLTSKFETPCAVAVSVAGNRPAGAGYSVTVPYDDLVAADAAARGNPRALAGALQDRGVRLDYAQELANMMTGIKIRGQFGAQKSTRDRRTRRADRVIAFFDTEAGRYLFQVKSENGQKWGTVTPADTRVFVQRVAELVAEIQM